MTLKTLLWATTLSVALAGPALAGKDTDTLTWATASEVDTPDVYYQNMREVTILAHQMCDTLMHRNPQTGKFVPLLAESYTWEDDTTLVFTLRDGVTFHDGSAFDAEDVAYTFNHLIEPDSGTITRYLVDWIDHVEVRDPRTAVFHAKAPTPMALSFLSGVTPVYPSGHYDDAPSIPGADGADRRDYGAVLPVCTGPYKLQDFQSGQSITLVKNDAYFADSPKGQPSIGTLVYRTISDTETQLAELVTGGIDWVWGVPSENAEQLRAMGGLTVVSAPTMRMSFLNLDSSGRSGDTPFQDERVRKAIFHAIDRKALAENLVGEGAEVLKAMCHPTQAACIQDIPQYDYDPDKARALLAEAGYPDGFEFTYYAYRDRPYSEAVTNYLRAVGLTPKLEFLQWKALRPLLLDGKTPLYHMTWGSQGVTDASASTGFFFKGSGFDYDGDIELTKMLDQADRTVDEAKREEIYRTALTRISERAYAVPLFSYGRTYAFNKDLDFPVTPDEIAHFYMAAWK